MKSTWIIFGASGDLARNRLFPAFAHCAARHSITIIAVDKQDASDMVPESLRSCVRWVVGDVRDAAVYQQIMSLVKTDSRFVYCATPPEFFSAITGNVIAAAIVHRDKKDSHIIYEKPYGSDYDSAHALFSLACASLGDHQIICIDHYLARSLVASIETLRFANGMFCAFWSAEYIESIRITLSEQARVHAPFYDTYGVLGDVLQNHVLQLLALTTMAEPSDVSYAAHTAAKQALLSRIRVTGVCHGRYEGYEDDVNIAAPRSGSYVLLECALDLPSWRGVRIYCEAGKGLAEKYTTITLRLRAYRGAPPNSLVITVVPKEGFLLNVCVKSPASDEIVPLTLDGCYECVVPIGSPAAYGALVCDLLAGNMSSRVAPAEVLLQWQIITQARALGGVFHRYPLGAERPDAAKKFLGADV